MSDGDPDVVSRLLEEQETSSGQLAAMEADLAAMMLASADSNADDEHDPEGATIAFERARLVALMTATRSRLEGIAEALGRAREGTYGRCVVCGVVIPAARLEARPFARTCVVCADLERR